MNKIHKTIAIAVVLCLAFANTGLLHTVHQHDENKVHDSDKCSVCLHSSFTKTILSSTAAGVVSVINEAEKISLPKSVVLPSVFLTTISSRAPPVL